MDTLKFKHRRWLWSKLDWIVDTGQGQEQEYRTGLVSSHWLLVLVNGLKFELNKKGFISFWRPGKTS